MTDSMMRKMTPKRGNESMSENESHECGDGTLCEYCDPEQGYCSEREDEKHCEHWWDGAGNVCCACGQP